MHGLFITGTDTGVGKTFITAALTRILRRRSKDVIACKPVATGAEWVGMRWLSDDTRLLAEACDMLDRPEEITPWSFPDPTAPPVAARRRGVTLQLNELARAVRGLDRPGRLLLVEGVGGLLCPLTESATIADLAANLGLPLIVVARRSLGTLNHTLLTLEAARARRLPVAGVVVTETSPVGNLAEETNVEELRKRIGVPMLAVVPHGADPEPQALAVVDWEGLAAEKPFEPAAGSPYH